MLLHVLATVSDAVDARVRHILAHNFFPGLQFLFTLSVKIKFI